MPGKIAPTLLMNITDMIDLSIGSPECGFVDFNLLHCVLHCLAQQLQVGDKTIELHGELAQTPVGDLVNVRTVSIDEYVIGTEDNDDNDDQTILVVERIPKLDHEDTKFSPLKPSEKARHRASIAIGKKKMQKGSPRDSDANWVDQKQPFDDDDRHSYVKKVSPLLPTTPTSEIQQNMGGQLDEATLPEHAKDNLNPSLHKWEDYKSQKQSGSDGETPVDTKQEQNIPKIVFKEDKPLAKSEQDNETSHEVGPLPEKTMQTMSDKPSYSIQSIANRMASTKMSEDKLSRNKSDRKLITQPSSDKLLVVTAARFNELENQVKDLGCIVYGSLPGNEEMLQDVRSRTNTKSISEMWKTMNFGTRLEVTEQAVSKLGSFLQDVIGENQSLKKSIQSCQDSTKGILSKLNQNRNVKTVPQSALKVPGISKEKITGGGSASQSLSSLLPGDLETLQEAVLELRRDLDKLAHDNMFEEGEEHSDELKPIALTARPEHAIKNIMQRLSEMDKRIKNCCESVDKDKSSINEQVTNLQEQLVYVMKDLSKAQAAGDPSEILRDLEAFKGLVPTVQEIQEELRKVQNTAHELTSALQDRHIDINVIIEQIEFLKTVKMDREDVAEAMAEKADVRTVARKVSRDDFEFTCAHLEKNLNRMIEKLDIQESITQDMLDEIQREIESKLDKAELMPVKDFFNTKLKQLQENLKKIRALRLEAEAAGTKKRLLRDVNCISCDAKAVMTTEPVENMHLVRPLPAYVSMKPYLSYELDTIRKAQQCEIPQRNLNDWEHIERHLGKPPVKVRSETDQHICNRYCGGSHTRTTPAQRVTRTGHFVKQWGPDVLPLSSGLAAGDDGRMYKVTTTDAAEVGPDGATKGGMGSPAASARSLSMRNLSQLSGVRAECHCLKRTFGSKLAVSKGRFEAHTWHPQELFVRLFEQLLRIPRVVGETYVEEHQILFSGK